MIAGDAAVEVDAAGSPRAAVEIAAGAEGRGERLVAATAVRWHEGGLPTAGFLQPATPYAGRLTSFLRMSSRTRPNSIFSPPRPLYRTALDCWRH